MSNPNEPAFDEAAYLALNPDVGIAVKKGQFKSGYAHWSAYGHSENRLCAAPGDPSGFDELEYLQRYPDVMNAVRHGGFRSGYEHWIRSGRKEGRAGSRLTEDAEKYLHSNLDIASAIATGAFSSPWEHWRQCGRYEVRRGVPREWLDYHTPINFNHAAGVNHFGFHGAVSGLGYAAAGYANAIATAGLPVSGVETPDWSDPNDTTVVDVSQLAPYRVNLIHQNIDVLPRGAARYGQSALRGRYNIGLWVWELHAAYAQAHATSRILNEIWVPSHFVANALANLSAAPVVRIPYVVESVVPKSRFGRSHFAIPNGAFVFLYAFDVSSGFGRKNPLALLSAFRRAFGDDASVRLILKYTQARHDPMASVILEHTAAPCRNVQTISSVLPENEYHSLLLASDCFVSPHRSEGFGLNIAAALVQGKPVIATGYSGNLDFTNATTAELIDYSLVPVGPGNAPYDANYVWADPDIDHLKELLKQVRFNPSRAQEKAVRGKRLLEKNNSRSAVGLLMKERLLQAGVLR